jgi:hypothetical protein
VLGETLTNPPREIKCKEIFKGEMLPLETKQSRGNILKLSYLRAGGVFLEEASRTKKRKRGILLGTLNVRSLYKAGSPRAAAWELAR